MNIIVQLLYKYRFLYEVKMWCLCNFSRGKRHSEVAQKTRNLMATNICAVVSYRAAASFARVGGSGM